ncbi:MAG: hypothetical protein ACXVLQ_06880 [Bacteriovorax sp.]
MMQKYLLKSFALSSLLGLSLISQMSHAVERPEVQGRAYYDACGYYSATVEDLHIRYIGPLEPGARVYLKYSGLGYNQTYNERGELKRIPFGWNSPVEQEMTATGPGVRELNISIDLRERTSNYTVDRLGFVFHVVMPNGEYWDNGHQSTWGSYEVDLTPKYIQCWDSNPEHLPAFLDLPISINNKN